MSEFSVTALGVGDTFSARHFPTALLLSASGFNLAIDCPDSYRRALAGARQLQPDLAELNDIDHVLITHVHGDHMNGLEGVAFFKRFVERKRVSLVTCREVRDVIWEQRLRAPMEKLYDGKSFLDLGFDDYFSHQELAWDEPISVGPFRIRARRTLHHVPTSALLIEANGRTLGYSSDTAFDPELMYKWVAKVSTAPASWDATARAVKSGMSLGIEVDRSKLKALTDDYWSYAFPPQNFLNR